MLRAPGATEFGRLATEECSPLEGPARGPAAGVRLQLPQWNPQGGLFLHPILLARSERTTARLPVLGTDDGDDALVAESLPDALALPAANRRIGVLVGNTDLPDGRGLGLAKAARAIHPKLGGIYPSRMLHRVPARERVTGALCLRLPCHPHPLVGVTGLLTGRLASDDEAQVAEEPLETSR